MNLDKLMAYTDIRRSCLTGEVVWIYTGPSKAAAWIAYKRACQREVERVRQWCDTVARRKKSILAFLNSCMAGIPITDELPPEKKEAARQLLALSKQNIPCHRSFYDHIIEEQRRKAEDREIRRKMRERDNHDYDKQ